MSDIETGGPAFPRTYNGDGHNGMTLRDYFAASFIKGALANPTLKISEPGDSATLISQSAYLFADAMLKARDV